ncbi:DUF5313 family protein [Rhodococcus sp. MEB041]|uniref:DUF5313 family protein n=1 Tax=Rhodococcus sp. MEB041 TaxID=3040323 RepID=UPI00254DC902|nr:DUF5313 family protein [Rhodococcus sp. MEB041]
MIEPTRQQWARYNVGGVLPPVLGPWVKDDLLGRGAWARYILRFSIPLVPLLSAFLLLPGPRWVVLGMMSLILLPVLYFAVGLRQVYTQFRLRQHGLDHRIPAHERASAAEERRVYRRNHGHD